MSQLTLPGLTRKRRDLRAEATIPCATARVAPAAHLTGDHSNRPIDFDDMNVFEGMPAGWQPGRDHAELGDGYGTRAIAYLRDEDHRGEHDKHAFDVDHLVPVGALCAVDPAGIDTDNDPTVPAANQRLLFDALDALDRLPGLYAVDAASFEMAANIAAIQTYLALRPDLLDRHEIRMQLAPLAAELAEVTC